MKIRPTVRREGPMKAIMEAIMEAFTAFKAALQEWARRVWAMFRRIARALGVPMAPPQKTRSGMTARQYRAARRGYQRELRQWRARL